MTTELPSINSTTSISDNADLRIYYEKLLFRNGSGKSLADLPQKLRRELNPQQQQQGHQEGSMDFINGFSNKAPFPTFQAAPSMAPSNSEPIPPPSVGHNLQQPYQQHTPQFQSRQGAPQPHAQPHQQQPERSMFYSSRDPLRAMGGFTLDFDRNGNNADYAGIPKQSVSPGSMVSSLHADPFYEIPTYQQPRQPLEERRQQYLAARRSSYISDTLIHGHLTSFMGGPGAAAVGAPPTPPPPLPTGTVLPPTLETENGYTLGHFGPSSNAAEMAGGPVAVVPPLPPSQARSLTTAPATMYGRVMQQPVVHQQPRRNTQPVDPIAVPMAGPLKTPVASLGARSRHFGYSKQQQQQQQQHQKEEQQQKEQQQQVPQQQSLKEIAVAQGNPAGQVPLDNGLVLINGQRIASSQDLQALFADCGSKYFSSEPVYEFADYIKSMLVRTANSGPDVKTKSISSFLAFLKSCNLNYNPQSDAFVSGEKQSFGHTGSKDRTEDSNPAACCTTTTSQERRPSMASAYLHYKPLVLVSLKNGKLELLSTPQNTNMLMQRGDLVIIDGDRGKDLALVVEPVVDLDLALFVNFLKKKIHFDSLITSRSQHHPNSKFIHSLVQSTKGQSEELNSKLYDVIELTQLIVPSKQVLRFATPWEITTNLHNKFQDELKALHIAQLKLKSLNSGFTHHHHGHGHSQSNEGAGHDSNNHNGNGNSTSRPQLNIKILNAEFQFDRKKLTFYYFCEERNDFRELIKELFKFYKTRIWLCAIPNNLGIDQKYYDSQRMELKMYQEMMQHYSAEDLADANAQQGAGFIVAPALNKIELDNFQIGVYKELVNELFGR